MPVYCGKIFLSKYKDEDARLVDGKHEALISEGLFYQVQEVLDGRKREPYKLKVIANTDMPLRGFLICPVFSRVLTDSASKGCQKHYSYYHCVRGCKCRFRTDLVNSEFEAELKKYVALPS